MQVKSHAQRSLAALAAGLLVTFSVSSQAITLTQPSYTHVSAAYTNGNNNTRGLFIDVEYELQHKFYVTGTFQNSKYSSTQGQTFRESIIDLGLGKYFTIADGLTFDTSASFGRYTPSSSLFDSGSNFYTLNAGIRNRFEAFETRLGYRHIKFSGRDADQGIVASAWYYPTPQMSVGITFNDVYSKSTWGFGARILF